MMIDSVTTDEPPTAAADRDAGAAGLVPVATARKGGQRHSRNFPAIWAPSSHPLLPPDCSASAAADNASQGVLLPMATSASRWTKMSPPVTSSRHRRGTPGTTGIVRRLGGALIAFSVTDQRLAPEQCLRCASLQLAHGGRICHGPTGLGVFPDPEINSLISVHEFPVIHRWEFRRKLLQILAFWWPPAVPARFGQHNSLLFP